MSSRAILLVVCVVALVWVGATVAVLVFRRDWPHLRRLLFAWHPGVRGGRWRSGLPVG